METNRSGGAGSETSKADVRVFIKSIEGDGDVSFDEADDINYLVQKVVGEQPPRSATPTVQRRGVDARYTRRRTLNHQAHSPPPAPNTGAPNAVSPAHAPEQLRLR